MSRATLRSKHAGKMKGSHRVEYVQHGSALFSLTLTSWQSFSPAQGAEGSDTDQATEPGSPCPFQTLQPARRDGRKQGFHFSINI